MAAGGGSSGGLATTPGCSLTKNCWQTARNPVSFSFT